ncbi:mannan endo-1,4-beta-mannosidase 4-like [Lactuca sativa]|uniref:mannan endo-1,4-beta-mannosidase 4-like n=1 Tax=Lactuca sativa TaxID=4236 RepID=UPI0022B024AB|nr:mannan endo-1,4-beta-mannosidase 4-like [Lactuca sativa]XP_052619818.1 mannan endo-1,4-beta-mannosidase 4-like [Lactuca sativa]XP_052619820.1 mannan endo-1,4-beta-mannosidase 4-like [Lactuca sativa]
MPGKGNAVLKGDCKGKCHPSTINDSFVETRTHHFLVNGKPLYFNGFNAYWLMCMASDPSTRVKVTDAFQESSKIGMNLVRTWAFSDGGNKPLQTSPGFYDEDMFKGLDFVISEAKKYGIHLILSLVNNWDDFGGKKQYVQWARDHGGQYLNSDDDFFTNVVVKGYYKNHLKTILTRRNSITGVDYKDDSTIFAWELMNEPRCQSDLSGKFLQEWIVEMAAEIKSIDKNHLLEIGLEGFYGESMPEKKQNNPGYEVGTDFITNNGVNNVDFATIHLYPDQWVPGASDEARAKFVEKWINAHIEDCDSILRKPLLIAEFGKSSWSSGYTVEARDEYFGGIFNTAYESARNRGSCSGTTFWQVMAEGMDNWGDGYQVVLDQNPSTAAIIAKQSQRISSLNSSTNLEFSPVAVEK